jgi:hypothetical protein
MSFFFGGEMTPNAAKNEVEAMVRSDLAAICKKLAGNSAVPEELRMSARGLAEEFDSLLSVRGKGRPSEHFEAEVEGGALLIRMARFLPRILDVQSWPSDPSTQ